MRDARLDGLEPSVRTIVATLAKRPVPADDAAYVRTLRAVRDNPFGRPGPALDHVSDLDLAAPDGRTIPSRLYRARAAETGRLLVWFHGGGFVYGDLGTHDAQLRTIAALASCNVLAVAYRLAPEAPYPAAIDDAHAALLAVGRDPGRFGADRHPIAVGGDSAGGNVATVATMLVRDRGGPAIGLQVLVYPDADARAGYQRESWRAFDGLVLDRTTKDRGLAMYLRSADRTSPHASPALASIASLRGLPRALVVTAEFDPQRDEAEAYAERLVRAGVGVELVRYPGAIHGFLRMDGALVAGRDLLERIARTVRAMDPS